MKAPDGHTLARDRIATMLWFFRYACCAAAPARRELRRSGCLIVNRL